MSKNIAPLDTLARKQSSLLSKQTHILQDVCLFTNVSTTGVEPARANAHYPLKVARLPIPPRGQGRAIMPEGVSEFKLY